MKKEDSPIKAIIYGIVGINLIIGLINGCTTYFVNDSFSEGFFDSAGWVILLSIFVIFILILSGLFGLLKK